VELQDVLSAAGASAALAGVFLLTVVAVVSTWRLSNDLRRGQHDLLNSFGRMEGLASGLFADRVAKPAEAVAKPAEAVTKPAEREGTAAVSPTESTGQLTSVSEQIRRLHEAVNALSESRTSELQEVAQAAGEMQNTLKRLESAVALMADGVAAFIQRLEGGQRQT
jgi:methyl-accepting chemotaxis protein